LPGIEVRIAPGFGIAHRALHLQPPLAGEKQHRRVRVDPFDVHAAMRRGIGQEREHWLLLVSGVVHRHGRPFEASCG
jgi:hypothetical protein